MIVDDYGIVGFTQKEITDYLRVNPNFDFENIFVLDGEQYEAARIKTFLDVPKICLWNERENTESIEEYHDLLQAAWLMPEEYENLNIEQILKEKCQTIEQLNRVEHELTCYKEFNLLNLLKYLKYLQDVAEKNNIVWGVGRGSSCCSYCLFLLKIHRVDSIKFGLEISEFLRN